MRPIKKPITIASGGNRSKEIRNSEDGEEIDLKVDGGTINSDESDIEDSHSDSNESKCVICEEEDPPGWSRSVAWVDCDVCAKNGSWRNVRRRCWLCERHA